MCIYIHIYIYITLNFLSNVLGTTGGACKDVADFHLSAERAKAESLQRYRGRSFQRGWLSRSAARFEPRGETSRFQL